MGEKRGDAPQVRLDDGFILSIRTVQQKNDSDIPAPGSCQAPSFRAAVQEPVLHSKQRPSKASTLPAADPQKSRTALPFWDKQEPDDVLHDGDDGNPPRLRWAKLGAPFFKATSQTSLQGAWWSRPRNGFDMRSPCAPRLSFQSTLNASLRPAVSAFSFTPLATAPCSEIKLSSPFAGPRARSSCRPTAVHSSSSLRRSPESLGSI